jgi:ribonuclease HI
MKAHNINIQWALGHIGIEGNELADKLANAGALQS